LFIAESTDPDFAEDALSADYVKLLQTITREEVDKYPTRCPHQETSEKITQVCSLNRI
jgi:chorismate synthase